MESAASSIPQQQQGQLVANVEPVSSSSSGSIGPFFAVISVLAILTIVSCVVGRMCSRRDAVTPLDSIKHRGCWGWVKGRCWRVNDIDEAQA
ncbi:hypothetical protein SLA2020_180440 [Shorea laevis]